MRKSTILLVVMLFTMFLFAACAQQEEISSDNGDKTTPTAGLTEAVTPTLSPTPTNVLSPTLGVDEFQSEAGVIESAIPDEDTCLFEYELKSDGTIRITGIKDRTLSTVSIPETIEEQCVTEIGAKAFAECKNLTDIEIPLSVTTIGEEAFSGCINLGTVELSYAVSDIGEYAFNNCLMVEIGVSQGTYAEAWALHRHNVKYVNYDLEYDISLNMGQILIGSEYYSAVYGESGALVWEWVDATFDTQGHYLVTFVTDDNNSPVALYTWDSRKDIYYRKDTRWFGWEEGEISFVSVGDDVFEIVKVYPTYTVNEGVFYNGKEGTSFSANTMDIPNYSGEYWFSRMNRLNEFSDGYSLMNLTYEYRITGDWKSDYRKKYCWVDTNGNILNYIDFENIVDRTSSDIYHDEMYYSTSYVGPYSDGVFYCDSKFLDLDLNVVLDLSGNGYKILSFEYYTPQFVDGVCSLIVYKNSKFWMFDIDKSGNTISEPEEIDILWLSY